MYRLVTRSVTREQNSGEVKAKDEILSESLYTLCGKDEAEVHFHIRISTKALQQSI